MTQEDKELLLKDLYARLPYGIYIQSYHSEGNIKGKGTYNYYIGMHTEDAARQIFILTSPFVDNNKPYLRPMSSMTEEEAVEIDSMGFAYWTTMINNDLRSRGPMSLLDAIITHHKMVKLIDWLNAHHFDYRGLIDKGLAIKAPEGMYEKKKA